MTNDNQTAIITIESIVPSDYGVKLNAQDKKVYNVSKTKKDGTPSVAWQQLTDMGLKGTDPIAGTPGSTVEIWYRESPNSHGGTSRYISSFKETNGVPTESPRQGANIAPDRLPQSESKEDFWDKKAYKQCLWGYWLQGQERLDTDEYWKNWETEVWAVFNRIEKDAEERFSKPKGWDKLGKKLKTEAFSSSIVNDESGQRIVQPFPVSPDIQEMADEMEISGEQIPY